MVGARSARHLAVLALALSTGACLAPASLRKASLEEGKSLALEAGFEAAVAAARTVLGQLGYTVNDDYAPDDLTRVILASAPGEGELLDEARVVVRRGAAVEGAAEEEAETLVGVLCRRVLPARVQIGGEGCEDRILGLIAAELPPEP